MVAMACCDGSSVCGETLFFQDFDDAQSSVRTFSARSGPSTARSLASSLPLHDSIAKNSRQKPMELLIPHKVLEDFQDASENSPSKENVLSPKRQRSSKKNLVLVVPPETDPNEKHLSANRMEEKTSWMSASVSAGDVLCMLEGSDTLARLGSSGGYMGHVMLVTSTPRLVEAGTEDAEMLHGVWPSPDVKEVWIVRTAECKRSAEHGIHISDHILYFSEGGQMMAAAEELEHQFLKFKEPVKVEVWQSPVEVREDLRLEMMCEILADMREQALPWSWTTALRAFSFSAEVPRGYDRKRMLAEIRRAWDANPICSSLVVVFWQRYLHQAAKLRSADPLDWILRWMPLVADRTLPGEMLNAMHGCGWSRVTHVPPGWRR